MIIYYVGFAASFIAVAAIACCCHLCWLTAVQKHTVWVGRIRRVLLHHIFVINVVIDMQSGGVMVVASNLEFTHCGFDFWLFHYNVVTLLQQQYSLQLGG